MIKNAIFQKPYKIGLSASSLLYPSMFYLTIFGKIAERLVNKGFKGILNKKSQELETVANKGFQN